MQLKVLVDYEHIDWEILSQMINGPVQAEATQVDQSFNCFKDCAYSSV